VRTNVGMKVDIIRQHEFDFIFVQKVTITVVLIVCDFETHLNIRVSIPGTEILARSTLNLTKVYTLPSGQD
jgi:hypothetical protein